MLEAPLEALVLLAELTLFVELVLLLLPVAVLLLPVAVLLLLALLSLLVALLWLPVVPLEPASEVTETLLDSTLVVWALLVTEWLPLVDVGGIDAWVLETPVWLTLNAGPSVPPS